MNVRFQADADLNQIIVEALRRREPLVDFQTATAAALEGLSDHDVLARTAASARVLVTHDLRTMPGHFADFVASATHPGVLIVPQRLPIRRAVEDLHLIWSVTEAPEWVNRLLVLPL